MTTQVRSLLIADDDLDDVMLLLSAMKECSDEVVISHVIDGEQLLKFLEAEQKPGLVLLDINMPKINGIDCLKRIKSTRSCDGIPVIMYSTSSNSETIEECFQHGATRYIIKPHRFEEIVEFTKMILTVDWKKSQNVSKDNFMMPLSRESDPSVTMQH